MSCSTALALPYIVRNEQLFHETTKHLIKLVLINKHLIKMRYDFKQ